MFLGLLWPLPRTWRPQTIQTGYLIVLLSTGLSQGGAKLSLPGSRGESVPCFFQLPKTPTFLALDPFRVQSQPGGGFPSPSTGKDPGITLPPPPITCPSPAQLVSNLNSTLPWRVITHRLLGLEHDIVPGSLAAEQREPGWDTPLHGPLSPLLPEALEPGLCAGAHNPVG